MPEATASRPYSWLPVLIGVLTIVMLAIGSIAFRYVETRMVATAGETLAHTAAEVSDKLDRFLIERHGDVLMMARDVQCAVTRSGISVDVYCRGEDSLPRLLMDRRDKRTWTDCCRHRPGHSWEGLQRRTLV